MCTCVNKLQPRPLNLRNQRQNASRLYHMPPKRREIDWVKDARIMFRTAHFSACSHNIRVAFNSSQSYLDLLSPKINQICHSEQNLWNHLITPLNTIPFTVSVYNMHALTDHAVHLHKENYICYLQLFLKAEVFSSLHFSLCHPVVRLPLRV